MKYLVSIFVCLLMMSCSGDDDATNDPNTNPSSIQGTWNLVKVTGGFVGINDTYETGVIVWDFNETTQKIAITNNNTDPDVFYDGLPTGTYDYSIEDIQGNKEIVVDKVNLGNLELTNNQIVISQQFKDGYQMTFAR